MARGAGAMTGLARLLRALVRRAVDGGLVRPRSVGFRHLPTLSAEAGRHAVTVLEAEREVQCALPLNCAAAADLPRERGRYERAFSEVPMLRVNARRTLHFENVRMLVHRDEYGDDFHAFVDGRDRLLPIPGTAFTYAHAALLRRGPVREPLGDVAWAATHSTRNHYMWLMTHLPRALLARRLGLGEAVLFPAASLLSEAKRATLDLLGLTEPRFLPEGDGIFPIERLTAFDVDAFDPDLLEELRAGLTGGAASAGEYLLISRERSHYRHLVGEGALLEAFPRLRAVRLEECAIHEQIRLLAGADLVVGAHGAGFANLLFCRPGTHVLEIQDPEDANPHFYMLAAVLGLSYQRLVAEVDVAEAAHFRDLHFSAGALGEAIRRAEAFGSCSERNRPA
jgi:hypothetical protein